TAYFDANLSAHVDLLEEALDQAMARHVPVGREYGLLLSGGQDSRLLAGYLSEKGLRATAFTFGLPTDTEWVCARRVARTLGFPFHHGEVPDDDYLGHAERQAKWEHGLNGFNTISDWGTAAQLRGFPRHFLAGFVMDTVIGGSIVYYYGARPRTISFDQVFAC